MIVRGFRAGLLAAGAVGIGGVPVAAHITPVVVLQKQADVVRATMPTAASFFLTDVKVERADAERIKAAGDFTLEDEAVKFYSGRNAEGRTVGVVLFPQLNTPHGPLEVGLTIDSSGAIASVAVTRVTAEAKPWVEQVIRSGGLARFNGVAHAEKVVSALDVETLHLDRMPAYFAGEVATAVAHGLVLYQILYAPSTPSGSPGEATANFLPPVVVE